MRSISSSPSKYIPLIIGLGDFIEKASSLTVWVLHMLLPVPLKKGLETIQEEEESYPYFPLP